ncbi:MAG: PAS domain S-box protein [Melioribacteraceae bacterium]|nr:PAS domain S-box protein [Melioribacteraceae bacterium]
MYKSINSNILHLIDFKKVDSLLEGFNKTTGFVTAILDLEGNVLSKSGWRSICTDFHRINPQTSKNCKISDTILANKMGEGEKYHFYKCLNGLIDVAVPIIINDEHVANLFSGQFFFEKPDSEFFKEQGKINGFNEIKYYDALQRVPIVSEKNVRIAMDFLLNMTQLISDLAFQKVEQKELIEKVGESEKSYKMLFESNPHPMWVYDLETLKFLEVNESAIKKYGYSKEEFLQLTLKDIRPSEDAQKLIENVRQVSDVLSFSGEWKHKNKAGEIFVVEIISHSINYKNREARLVVANDITDRRIAEEKIREKDIQFQKLSANVPDLLYQFTRRPDGTYIVPVASQGIKNIFGCSPEDVLEDFNPIAKVIHPDDAMRVIKDIEYSAEHLSYFTCEFRVNIPGKDTQWILSRSNPERLPDGSITWYGFNVNITEHKLVEEKLIESETRYRNIIETSPVGIFILQNDKVVFINPGGEKIFGAQTPEQLIGKQIRDFMHPDNVEKSTIRIQRLLNGETGIYPVENRYIKLDGEIIEVEVMATLLSYKHEPAIQVIFIDITERKRLREELEKLNGELELKVEQRTAHLEEANRELESFSYSVSHDLRSPLRHINGYVDLLYAKYKDKFDGKALHYLETISSASKQMGTLIDDLLQYSRTGRVEFTAIELDLNVLLIEVMKEIEPVLRGRKINWDIQELPKILGDYTLLKQVWINLLDNAVKYTRNQQLAKISVGYNINDKYFVFFVRDNGVGFDMNYVHKLFGVFQRLHSPNEFEGTGIGLANVQRIIHKHSGKVWAESEPGIGASFYFSLPIMRKGIK